MAKGKLILICQSGGEFVTDEDGTMFYNGGEANAENVTSETPFNDIKLKLAEACNLDLKTVTIKYFLPGNKKNLIVMKNDKDVKRMIDFHGNAITAEVFVTGTPGFDRSALEIESNRESGSKKVETLRKDETSKHENAKSKKDDKVPTSPIVIKSLDIESNRESGTKKDETFTKDETVKHGKTKSKKDGKVPTSPIAKRTRRATAKWSSADKSDGATSANSGNETSSTSDSDHGNEKQDSEYGSDYVPKRSGMRKANTLTTLTTSPADAVKKRRRTPSWKYDAKGRPTILSVPDSGSKPEESGKDIAENSQRKSRKLAVKKNSSKTKKSRVESDPESESDKNLSLTVFDEYGLTENMVDSWKSAITGVGQEFDSVNEFRAALKKYAIANRFGYRFKKNDTSRAVGRCAAEGCTWKFYAAWVPMSQSFVIKTMNNSHTCDKESRKSAHPAKNWLVGTIRDRLKESPYLKPKEIANGILQDFGVELNYTQVWRGIGDAREQLHGSPKESYNKLPWFCAKVLETNPGSVAKLVIGDKKRFKSLFVSFNALIRGFRNCRPLIFLEAYSLKSRYGESVLIAIAVDGNDGFIPVAFAIVDVEDDDTWRWFLEELKGSILDSRVITFVVDRDKKLKKLVLEIFENAYIGYSIFHLLASFKRHMKGPFHGDGKAFLAVHLLAAAQAVRPVGFKKSTEHIKTISSQAYDWVMQIEPENYASCYFKGERYNHITEDVGEPYAKLMEDRHLPILQKIDALIRVMIDDVEDAKSEASNWAGQLTALKAKELEKERVRARGLKVFISSEIIFEVREESQSTHVVNVGDWSCTCMGWKATGLPCHHAVAVLDLTGKNPYDFCSSYFTADAYRLTYAESIRPVPIDGPPPLYKDEGKRLDFWNVEGRNFDPAKIDGRKLDFDKIVGRIVDAGKEEGRKLSSDKVEGRNVNGEKDEGRKLGFEKVEGRNVGGEKMEGGNVDAEKGEGGNLDDEKDEGGNLGTEMEEDAKKDEGSEKDEGSKVETEKDEGRKMDVEKDEGSNVDNEMGEGMKLDDKKDEGGKVETEKDEGSKVETEKDEGSKVETEKDEGSQVETEKEEGIKMDVEKDEGGKVETEKDEGSKVETEKDEGSKVETEKEEGSQVETEKEEGIKMDVEKDEGSNVDTEMEEGMKLDDKKDEGGKVETEKDEGSKVETEKEEGVKMDVEKDEGSNVDTEMGEGVKLDDEKDKGGKVETEKEEGGKLDVEKDEGSNVDTKMEEGVKLDDEKDEGGKVETEKDEGSKVETEKEEGVKMDVEKDEGSHVDTEMEEGVKLDDKKDEGGELETEKEEGSKVETEKEEGGKLDIEKNEGSNVDTKMEEGVKLDDKKDEGGKLETEKDEGSKVETEKEEGGKLDIEKDEGSHVDTKMEEGVKLDDKKDEERKADKEKDEGRKVETEKEEGGKLEGEKDVGKIREEHEDPNVFVLPPIPVKGSSSMVKKEFESVETESEIKRKVTCSKCKQTGHYRKSCKVDS